MTHAIHLLAIAGAMAAVFGLPPLASTASNQTVAQITISEPGVTRSYYNGYRPRYDSRYASGNGRSGYTGYGNGPYGYGSSTTYGYRSSTPFGYRSSISYEYPSSGAYGDRIGTSYRLYYRGVRLRGGTYRPVYNPNNDRFYSPYGYGGY